MDIAPLLINIIMFGALGFAIGWTLREIIKRIWEML